MIACFGESLREEELHKHERTYKDDVYSVGISLLELALIGCETNLPDVTSLNRDGSEDKLNALLKYLGDKGYSEDLVSVLKSTLRFEEACRVDFNALDQLV